MIKIEKVFSLEFSLCFMLFASKYLNMKHQTVYHARQNG